MDGLLRSYAVSLLTERVIYARSPLKYEGKPIKSYREAGPFVLGKALELALNPPEKVTKDINDYFKSRQWWGKVEEGMKRRIATADAEGVLGLIRRLSTRSVFEVYFNSDLVDSASKSANGKLSSDNP
jgi:hypothetical protein